MDFDLHEDLIDLQGLVREIVLDHSAVERLAAQEQTSERFDATLWSALADSGITGLTVPEEYGGAGLGIAAVAVVLEEQGARVAALPLAASLLAAEALANGRSASPEADKAAGRLLPGLATGEHRLTLALEESAPVRFTQPRTRATSTADGWRVSGTKVAVPATDGAAGIVLSAQTIDGVGIFLVELPAAGVDLQTDLQSDRTLASRVDLVDAPGVLLGMGAAVDALWQRARVAVAAAQVGVTAGAVAIAAEYVSHRTQFGQPLGAFQSTQHRLADARMGIDALRVALCQAVDDLDRGRAESARSSLVAQWWAAKAGMDVVLATQHVHGGIGVDVDYPIHRYFLWGRQLATMYGGSLRAAAELGDLLVEERSA